MIRRIKDWFAASAESKELENWFEVAWDKEFVYRNVSPPGKKSWSDNFRWSQIERICFEATDPMYSEGLYFSTSERAESCVVPTEVRGGSDLWEEVLRRKLFDPELAVKAALSESGMFCWSFESDANALSVVPAFSLH